MAKTKNYRVVYEHDGAVWHVHTPDVDGCQSQGRTLPQARERIRKALGLFDTNAHRAAFVEDVRLPRAALASLKKTSALRDELEARTRELEARQAKLARELMGEGVSTHDVAELLGVTKARIAQFLQ